MLRNIHTLKHETEDDNQPSAAELEALTRQHEMLQRAHEHLQCMHEESDKELASQKQRTNDLARNLEIQRKIHLDLQQTRKALAQRVEDAAQEIQAQADGMSALQEKHATLEERVDVAEQLNKILERDNNNLKERHVVLEQKCNVQDTELKRLKILEKQAKQKAAEIAKRERDDRLRFEQQSQAREDLLDQQVKALEIELQRQKKNSETKAKAEQERLKQERLAAIAKLEKERREDAARHEAERDRISKRLTEATFSALASHNDDLALELIRLNPKIDVDQPYCPGIDNRTLLDYARVYNTPKSMGCLLILGNKLVDPTEGMFSALASNNDAGFLALISNTPYLNLAWRHDNKTLLEYAEIYAVPNSKQELNARKARMEL